ncbi:MAG: hypothetical protein H0W88_07325 [Parachlamydiaceae bacterium]|nr:hypothetical protein [Parachlamydiaceae bacterium]
MVINIVKNISKYTFIGLVTFASSLSAQAEYQVSSSCSQFEGGNPFQRGVERKEEIREQLEFLFNQHVELFFQYATIAIAKGEENSQAKNLEQLLDFNAEQIATVFACDPAASWLLHLTLQEYQQTGLDYVKDVAKHKSQSALDERINYFHIKTQLLTDTLGTVSPKLDNKDRIRLKRLFTQLTKAEIQFTNQIAAGVDSQAALEKAVNRARRIANISFKVYVHLFNAQLKAA